MAGNGLGHGIAKAEFLEQRVQCAGDRMAVRDHERGDEHRSDEGENERGESALLKMPVAHSQRGKYEGELRDLAEVERGNDARAIAITKNIEHRENRDTRLKAAKTRIAPAR